jgi:hypothetical protein
MGSGKKTNSSIELVIYKSTTWEDVNIVEEINIISTIVTKCPAGRVQLLSDLYKGEEPIKFLADGRKDYDTIEPDIFELHNYCKILRESSSELFRQIT